MLALDVALRGPSSRRWRGSRLLSVSLLLAACVLCVDAIAIHQPADHDADKAALTAWVRPLEPIAIQTLVPLGFKNQNLPPRFLNPRQTPPQNLTQPRDCTFPGDSDLYGLGVRLGVYFQWLTSFIANVLIPEEISSSLDQNAIFLFAILIATLKNTIQGTIHLLDALILLEISFGYFFSVLSLFGYRTKMYGKAHLTLIGTYIRMFLAASTSGYAAWFWFSGIDWLNARQPSPCDPLMFMFVKVRVFGWMRYVWRVLAIAVAIYFIFLFLAGIISAILWISLWCYDAVFAPGDGFKVEWIRFWKNEETAPGSVVDPKKARRAFIILSIFNVAFIPWSIVNIEFTINWNDIVGVTGTAGLRATGQLIPALIGGASCVRIIWLVIWQAIEARKRKKEFFNADPASPGELAEKRPGLEQKNSFDELQAAQSKAFQLNGEILINLLSFGFIKRKERDGKTKKPGETSSQDPDQQQPAEPLLVGSETAGGAGGEAGEQPKRGDAAFEIVPIT